MGEDDVHVQATVNGISFLQYWFRDRTDVYVMGNNFVYWNEGFPRDRVSPDCYVVLGVENRPHPSYKSWEEGGKLPDVVFEFTSRSTGRQDTERKFTLYEQIWKSQEYFLFDPSGEYITPQLKGYTLVNGKYESIPCADNTMHSDTLGLDLEAQGSYLRFFDPKSASYIPTMSELRTDKDASQKRILALEAELTELRRKLGRVD